MRESRALCACVPAGFPLAVSTSSIFPLPVYFGIPFILRPWSLVVFHLNSTVSTAHRLLLSSCDSTVHFLHFSSCGKEKGGLRGGGAAEMSCNLCLACAVSVAAPERAPLPLRSRSRAWRWRLEPCPPRNPLARQPASCLYSFTCAILVSSRNPRSATVT